MSKINGNEIRPGYVIEYQNTLWVAVKTMAVKPGKGPAYNQVELKNLLDGRKLNQRFGGADRVEETEVERRQFQFLYQQDDQLVGIVRAPENLLLPAAIGAPGQAVLSEDRLPGALVRNLVPDEHGEHQQSLPLNTTIGRGP